MADEEAAKASAQAVYEASLKDVDDELSAYERQRLAHIKRNAEFMRMLGLLDDQQAHAQVAAATGKDSAAPKAPRKPRVKPPPVPPELLRR